MQHIFSFAVWLMANSYKIHFERPRSHNNLWLDIVKKWSVKKKYILYGRLWMNLAYYGDALIARAARDVATCSVLCLEWGNTATTLIINHTIDANWRCVYAAGCTQLSTRTGVVVNRFQLNNCCQVRWANEQICILINM